MEKNIRDEVYKIVEPSRTAPTRCVIGPQTSLVEYLRGLDIAPNRTLYVARCLVRNGWTSHRERTHQKNIHICGALLHDGPDLVSALERAEAERDLTEQREREQEAERERRREAVRAETKAAEQTQDLMFPEPPPY
jgi:hypothetical protein